MEEQQQNKSSRPPTYVPSWLAWVPISCHSSHSIIKINLISFMTYFLLSASVNLFHQKKQKIFSFASATPLFLPCLFSRASQHMKLVLPSSVTGQSSAFRSLPRPLGPACRRRWDFASSLITHFYYRPVRWLSPIVFFHNNRPIRGGS